MTFFLNIYKDPPMYKGDDLANTFSSIKTMPML